MSASTTVTIDGATLPGPNTPKSAQWSQSVRVSGGRNAVWYEKGSDGGLYANARQACRDCTGSLRRLKLTAVESWMLQVAQKQGFKAVRDAISLQEADAPKLDRRRSRHSWVQSLNRFTTSFCEFATRWSAIVELLLPNSPEFSIAYGLLNLLFSSTVEKNEKQEELVTFIDNMVAHLPRAEFYVEASPTNSMKLCLSSIFVRMTTALLSAVSYYRNSSFAKLTDILSRSQKHKFDEYSKSLEVEIVRLKELKKAADVGRLIDTQETVESMGTGMARMYALQESRTADLRISLESVQQELGDLRSNFNDWRAFQVTVHAQDLCNCLLQAAPTCSATGDIDTAIQKVFLLSERDRWENNGILSHLADWAHSQDPKLLWVSGDSGHHGSWVSGLSVDIVRALQPEDCLTLYAFCNAMPDGNPPTAIHLVKALLVQILSERPQILLSTPSLSNLKFGSYNTTFSELWLMLGAVVRHLAYSGTPMIVILDRVDHTVDDDEVSIQWTLLPQLVALTASNPVMKVMVTSVYEPPEEFVEDPRVENVHIDTSIRAKDGMW